MWKGRFLKKKKISVDGKIKDGERLVNESKIILNKRFSNAW
jgi:hypothetical protein